MDSWHLPRKHLSLRGDFEFVIPTGLMSWPAGRLTKRPVGSHYCAASLTRSCTNAARWVNQPIHFGGLVLVFEDAASFIVHSKLLKRDDCDSGDAVAETKVVTIIREWNRR